MHEELFIRAKTLVDRIESEKLALSNLLDTRTLKIEELEKLQSSEQILQRVMLLFKNLSESENEKSKNMFISLINHGLHSIFGSSVSFDLERKDYATGTFYSPVLLKDGKQEDLWSSGGGILDIVSFLCRIVILVSFYTKDSRVLRLDEPFKNLSKEYREKATQLIKQLSDQFEIQFIFTTHVPEYVDIEGAKVFKAERKDGSTTYTEV